MKFLGPTERPRLNEVVALLLLLAGICTILSLVSYSPLDLSWNTVARAAKPTNLLGEFGAHLADFTLQALGLAAYAIPFGLFCLGWKWVRSAPIDGPGVKALGFLMLAFAIASAFGLWSEWKPIGGAIPASGLLGMLLAGFLVAHFNELGAWLVTMGALTLSLYLVSTFHIRMVGEWFAGPIGAYQRLADRFADWREQRAERAAGRREARVRAAVEAAAVAQQHASTFTADLRPRRARAAAAGANGAVSINADPMARAGIFPVADPAIVPYESRTTAVLTQEEDDDFDPLAEHEPEDDDIPIHTVAAPPREVIPERRVAAMPAALAPDLPKPKSRRRSYTLPPTELLNEAPQRAGFDSQELKDVAVKIKAKFEEFNVFGNVVQINPGPVVTTFEFKPEAGVKYSRITSLHEDLCLGLQAESILIERIPGKSTIGIEVPNTKREIIALREILESPEFNDSPSKLTIAMGKDISGRIKVASLETMPHCLIAGSTGSGKSVMLNTLIMSVLYKSTPDDVRMILIDPKRLEMGLYEGVPHLLTPVITDPKKATNALRNAVLEMERRLKLLAIQGVRNLEQYNKKIRLLMNEPRNLFDDEPDLNAEEELRPLPYVLLIIDELADLMMLERAGVEESVTRLAQMARAVGMHLVLATQRPSVDVITGLIKANFPSRISFRVATRVDSRTVLDSMGAEHLLGKGDMLYLAPGTSRLLRIHGSFVSEIETNQLVDYWKKQADPEYDKSYLMAPPAEDEPGGAGEDGEEVSTADEDPVYQDAVRVVCEMGKASTSILQRRLRLGYGRAARMLDMMQRDGIIGPPDGSRPREVLKRPDWLSEVASLP